MKNIILHCDINHCYAQIEEMKHPHLRHIPMAVGGNEEQRHGIILAKNDIAKTYQIQTGESLREAYAKCPQLQIIPPHYDEYLYYTEKVKDIYREYSDRVESFGLDEAWLDVSASLALYGSGLEIAKRIQQRVFEELGLTISIGISYNKIFAKLGSDMIKHKGLVEITEKNYQQLVWGLAVSDLLYIGRATAKKMEAYDIHTIGELACMPLGWMQDHFGKMGEVYHLFANGKDVSEVAWIGKQEKIKSVGNAITTPKDVESFEEAKLIYYVLVESVAARLKEAGLQGNVVMIHGRTSEFQSFTRQRKIICSTNLCEEVILVVLDLLKQHYDFTIPLRTLGVSVSGLRETGGYQQLNMFVNEEERQKQQSLEKTIDQIREKYGYQKARRCSMKIDQELTGFDPKSDHVIYPISYFGS